MANVSTQGGKFDSSVLEYFKDLQNKGLLVTREALISKAKECARNSNILWEPTTMLANQRGPQQHQHPLSWAPLAAVNKDVDHIALVGQSRLQDSSSGVHTAATSPTDSKTSHLDPLGSPLPAQASLLQPVLHQHS
jgi:hypothetical protein